MGNVAIILDNVHASATFDIQYIITATSVDREGKGEQRTGSGAQPQENLGTTSFLRLKRELLPRNTLQNCAFHLLSVANLEQSMEKLD